VSARRSLHSNSIRNATSARVSVPSYLTPAPDETDPGPQGKQVWRTDLLATEPYWAGERRGIFVVSRPSSLSVPDRGGTPPKHSLGCGSRMRCCRIEELTHTM
jgi:hypothetical protein